MATPYILIIFPEFVTYDREEIIWSVLTIKSRDGKANIMFQYPNIENQRNCICTDYYSLSSLYWHSIQRQKRYNNLT